MRLEGAGPALTLTLDRPPLNVLDLGMLEELAGALDCVEARSDVSVLLVRGAGKAFCAGVDVADHTAERVAPMLEAFHGALRRLMALDCMVVAAVHGAVLGGGLELALAADVVLARDDATLGQPEIRLGVFPPVAAALMPRRFGAQRAFDLILSGRTLTAAEAHEAGLVARVFAGEAFEAETAAYVAGVAGHSVPVVRLTKALVRDAAERPFAEALELAERRYLDDLMALDDPHEGLAAFLERRRPVWKGA
ncbi:MAG: enoyl-CoA hydratase/isomerase family protein [Gemmatimonadetes bacterium]|nr:MAG: enoyl-CoA hydratase/isomerase family protein [Gemmatimonadota bacterium]